MTGITANSPESNCALSIKLSVSFIQGTGDDNVPSVLIAAAGYTRGMIGDSAG